MYFLKYFSRNKRAANKIVQLIFSIKITNILSDHVRSRNVQIPSSCVFKILLSHCMIALLEMPKKVPKKIEFILYDFLIPTINLT